MVQGLRTAAFAESVVVDQSQVIPAAQDLPLDRACLLACGVITGVGAVINTVTVEPGSNVVVVGTGGVGLNCIQGAALVGAARIIAIDLVREKNAERRGGGERKITLNTEIGEALAAEDEPLRVDDALAELAKREPRLAQVVEMRYFGGYKEEEVAEALGITTRTVQRDWKKARVLLQAMLSDSS